MSDFEIANIKEQMKDLKNMFIKFDNKLDELYNFNLEYKTKELICKDTFDSRYILIEDFDHKSKEISDKRYIQIEHAEAMYKDKMDNRYMQIKNAEQIWLNLMEKYQTNNLNKLNNKTNLFRNILNIVQMLTPYIIMFFALK